MNSAILLYTGIVLVAVPLMLMIGFAAFIFIAFMRDDDTTSGIMKVALAITGLGLALIVAHYVINWIGN